jgi:O-antigen/teichoic acid export membrane protein
MYQRSFRLSTLTHLLGGFVVAGGNFLLAPVYLRLLSPSDFGVWSSYLLSVQVLQSLLCWGMLGTMNRLLIDADDERRPRLIGAGVRLSSGLNILFIVFLWASLPVWQKWVTDAAMPFIFLFAAVSSALSVYPAILMGLYIADNDALRYRSVGLLGFGLQVSSLTVAVLFIHLDAQGAILAMLLGMSAYATLTMWRLWPEQKGDRIKLGDYSALLIFGLPVMFYTLIGQASDFLIRSLLAAQVSRADFGAFSAGLLLASTIAMVSSAVNLAWVPLYYRKASVWNMSGVYSHFVETVAATTALGAAFVIIFSNELLTFYSGGRMQLPGSCMAGLVIAAWLNSAVWMGLSNPLFQQKRSSHVLALAMAATVLSMPLAWLLIDMYGLVGASWSLVLSALLLCALAALMMRYLGIPSPKYARLALLLLILIGLSGPWFNFLYFIEIDWVRIFWKVILMATTGSVMAALFLRRGLLLIKRIEKEISS